MTVTFGVVGFGGRDKTVYRDLARLDWLRLDSMCDSNEEHLNACADDLAVEKRFTRYQDMLESDLDFIFIATPPALHVEMAIQALQAGKHVICEIPTVCSPEEAHALLECVERTGLLYMAAENYCYRRDIQAFTRFIRNGELGRIVYAQGVYAHDDRYLVPEWNRKRIRTWFDRFEQPRYITHALGPLLYATGDRVVSIAADGVDGRTCFDGDEPFFTAANCRNESVAVFQLFYTMGANRFGTCFSFTGDTGSIESFPFAVSSLESNPPQLGDTPYRLTRQGAGVDPAYHQGRMIDLAPGDPFNSYRGGSHWESDLCILAVFAECVRDGKPVPIDARMGIDMTLAGIAAVESMRTAGAPVKVPRV